MKIFAFKSLFLQYKCIFLLFIILGLFIILPQPSFAHQQPTTIVLLDITPKKVGMELEIPLSELELAVGHNLTETPEESIKNFEPQLKEYLLSHIRPVSENNQPWSIEITKIKVEKAEQTQSGTFQEIRVNLDLTPPEGASTRKFTLNYDLIMHQVVTHRAFVSIRNDWETGRNGEEITNAAEANVIAVDTGTGKISALEINLEKGDLQQAFGGMVKLGMQHIKEGTDHLLFLLVLLLPATLLTNGKRWGDFGGSRNSLFRLLKIVTAFTVGHSLTLLVGALDLFRVPQQPIEVLIAVSILISAVHAVRPIFPGKEMYVAAGFGLIHGLAFAAALSELHLTPSAMALSILGFNIGIELMQLFVVALVVPWLMLLSQTAFYSPLRIAGAVTAAIAAIAWIVERITGNPNAIAGFVQNVSQYAHLGIFVLALLALLAFGLQYYKRIPLNEQQPKRG